MADAAVRTAVPSDAAEITRIQLNTWRSAYRELLPEAALNELDQQDTERHWLEAIEGVSSEVLVAEEGNWTVGFCAGGTAPRPETANADGGLPDDVDTVGLVSTLLVEPRWGRRGHGGRLLGHLAGHLREQGVIRTITWVPESDEASIAFYRGIGWEPDGTVRTLDARGHPLRELRLTGGLDLRLE